MLEKLDAFNEKYNLELYFPKSCVNQEILDNHISKFKNATKIVIDVNKSNASLLRDLIEVVKEVKEYAFSLKQALTINLKECNNLRIEAIEHLDSFEEGEV